MLKRFITMTSFGCAGALIAFGNCSCSSGSSPKIGPARPVSVSLVQIASSLPDWDQIRQFDLISKSTSSQAAAVSLPSLKTGSPQSNALQPMGTDQSVEKLRLRAMHQLQASSNRVLSVIEARIARQAKQRNDLAKA